jgi:predicted transcriptional regulator
MRVNARLDDETQRQLQYLIEATGSGVSDVLKASLAHYYQKVRADQRPRLRHLSASIGKVGSGRSDISARAKELLADAIGDKVTARQPRSTRDAK